MVFSLVGLVLSQAAGGHETVRIQVPRDHPTIAAAVAAAPDRAVVEIAAGAYRESIVLRHPVTLRPAGDGPVVVHGVDNEPVIQIVDASDVIVEGMRIVGGQYGVVVLRSTGVTIRSNDIIGSRLTGILVRLAAADILGNVISHGRHPYGRGVHVTNTMAWPESRVIGNTIADNALSGITTNMTGMITIHGNLVADNGRRGIAITEMSHARVSDNVVERNVETGIQVVDYSVAVICNNTVVDTLMPDPSSSPRYGNGITIDFYSEVVLAHNLVRNSPQYGIGVLFGSLVELYRNDLIGNVALPVHVDGAQAFELDEHTLAAHGCGALPTESP